MICYTDKHHIPFQIDEEDYESVSRYTWCIDSTGYPSTHSAGETIRLHYFLMRHPSIGLEWSHKDNDKLNNQRDNLQPATRVMNARNSRSNSPYRGIYNKKNGRFYVQLSVDGRKVHLGTFDTIEEALEARRIGEATINELF